MAPQTKKTGSQKSESLSFILPYLSSICLKACRGFGGKSWSTSLLRSSQVLCSPVHLAEAAGSQRPRQAGHGPCSLPTPARLYTQVWPRLHTPFRMATEASQVSPMLTLSPWNSGWKGLPPGLLGHTSLEHIFRSAVLSSGRTATSLPDYIPPKPQLPLSWCSQVSVLLQPSLPQHNNNKQPWSWHRAKCSSLSLSHTHTHAHTHRGIPPRLPQPMPKMITDFQQRLIMNTVEGLWTPGWGEVSLPLHRLGTSSPLAFCGEDSFLHPTNVNCRSDWQSMSRKSKPLRYQKKLLRWTSASTLPFFFLFFLLYKRVFFFLRTLSIFRERRREGEREKY